MRISRDDSSWKASGVKRRDFRASSNDPEVSRKGKKKNTRRWCKGVVGRERDYEIGIAAPRWNRRGVAGEPVFIVDKCKVCGKKRNWRRNPKFPSPRGWT